ncbi:hypothetical protein Trydic_g12745 [Trypoxylus dichotomus]
MEADRGVKYKDVDLARELLEIEIGFSPITWLEFGYREWYGEGRGKMNANEKDAKARRLGSFSLAFRAFRLRLVRHAVSLAKLKINRSEKWQRFRDGRPTMERKIGERGCRGEGSRCRLIEDGNRGPVTLVQRNCNYYRKVGGSR